MQTNTAHAAPPDTAEPRFGAPLTPGLADQLGERWNTVDAADSTPLELLRFRGGVAGAPGFEDALRRRVELLANFKDLAFPAVRDVAKVGEQLTLISSAIAGQRLSDMWATIPKAKRVPFVTRLLRDATHALAALEAAGPGVTHGALTAERIILTAEGRVSITEHALAPALQALALWPEELWTDFGLLARPDDDGEAVFDARTTVMQLAVIALSILLGRQITLQDFERRLPALLDEFTTAAATSTPSAALAALREWLESALQIAAGSYATAAAADAALRKLLAGLGPAGTVEFESIHLAARTDRSEERQDPVGAVGTVRSEVSPVPWRRPDMAPPPHDEIRPASARTTSLRERYLLWATIALVGIAIGEAIAITRLNMRPPTVVLTDSSITIESPRAGDTVMVDGKAVGSTPLRVRVNPKTQAIRLIGAPAPAPAPVIDSAAVSAKAERDRTAAALDAAAARQRSGGVSITAPIPLTVLEGDRVLGSTTDGPIVAAAGQHQLDFVNTALGYRSRQTVTIRQGVIAPLAINLPMGRISINAQPWAQVLIDDMAVGETPLANLAVPIGEHQITFRHPQMGERRERVTVRADAPARVSTTFQR